MQGGKEDQKNTSILLIRHAESEANVAYELVKRNEEELRLFTHDPKYIDPTITEKGYEECKRAAAKMKEHDIGVVLISPFRRALQTATEVFKDHPSKPKLKAFPIIGERIYGTSGNISNLSLWEKDFPHVDFSELENLPHRALWHIYQMEETLKNKLLKPLLENLKTPQEINEKGHIHLLGQYKALHPEVLESDKYFRDRISRALKIVRTEVDKIPDNKKVVLVSHWGFLRDFTAKGFDQDGKVIEPLSIKNCDVMEYDLP